MTGLHHDGTAVTLYSVGGQCTLADAVAAFAEAAGATAASAAHGQPVALAWTATWCRWATLDGSTLVDADGGALDLAGAFEARLFGPSAELRWLHDIGGVGDAVLLAEGPLPTPPELTDPWAEDRRFSGTIEGVRYLLWGGDDPPLQLSDRWSTLADGRIGSLRVPTRPPDTAIAAIEYLERDPATGAVRVAEERLVGFGREVTA